MTASMAYTVKTTLNIRHIVKFKVPLSLKCNSKNFQSYRKSNVTCTKVW